MIFLSLHNQESLSKETVSPKALMTFSACTDRGLIVHLNGFGSLREWSDPNSSPDQEDKSIATEFQSMTCRRKEDGKWK
jgi:hypothetical protein